MGSRVSKFVNLGDYLYRNDWVHFRLSGEGWTEGLEGEEKIFGIVIRTLLCNDKSSEKFYNEIGKLAGTKAKYERGGDFIGWLTKKLSGYPMGSGQGSHRDGRHRIWTPQGIKEYLELTNFKQREYFNEIHGYNKLFNDLESIQGNGPLTAFDLTKRFYEAGVITFPPDRFYLTGGGEVEGVKALFPSLSERDLIVNGTDLVKRIIDKTGMSEDVAYFGVEDLLCIYQKDKRYEEFLNCQLSVEEYGSILLDKSCIRERGVC